MKTINLIKQMLPILANVIGSGILNQPIASMAREGAAALRAAAKHELLIVTDVTAALDGVVAARDHDSQQVALQAAIAAIDGLIDAINDGTVGRHEAEPRNVLEIITGMVTNATYVRDTFKPDAGRMDAIRRSAAEVSALVDAEVNAGTRLESDAAIAATMYQQADVLPDLNYANREHAANDIITHALRLAA